MEAVETKVSIFVFPTGNLEELDKETFVSYTERKDGGEEYDNEGKNIRFGIDVIFTKGV